MSMAIRSVKLASAMFFACWAISAPRWTNSFLNCATRASERTEALVAQFKKEFVQRGAEIAQQAKNIAEANFTERMAIDMSRPNADLSLYVRDAIGSAQEHGLDYVEFVNYDGVLISSAQFPARVGYKNDWLTAVKDWNETAAFLKKEELP